MIFIFRGNTFNSHNYVHNCYRNVYQISNIGIKFKAKLYIIKAKDG